MGDGGSPTNFTVPVTVPPFDTVMTSYAQAVIEPLANRLKRTEHRMKNLRQPSRLVIFAIHR